MARIGENEMSKLCCVPQEITDAMILAFHDEFRRLRHDGAYVRGYAKLIQARPPLPADIEKAVELATDRIRRREERRRLESSDSLGDIGSGMDQIDHALLKACGIEP
jgi:hypothetical protein